MFGFGRGFGRRRGTLPGPGGYCICTNPKCRHQIAHTTGIPCYKIKCPKCGSPMVRK